MPLYKELSEKLNALADKKYAAFQSGLLADESIKVLGVRVPQLRRLAKEYRGRVDELLSLPDTCYEITFIKLIAASYLPYEEFIKRVDKCVSLIDNWATCDSFTPACLKNHREEFIPYIEKYLSEDSEFSQRFALKTLLSFYVEEKYLPLIEESIYKVDTKYYYVHMAAAWLVAEIAAKYFDYGESILIKGKLDIKTHNKAIRKAIESFRLSQEDKNRLRTLKK